MRMDQGCSCTSIIKPDVQRDDQVSREYLFNGFTRCDEVCIWATGIDGFLEDNSES
jgi:hypothetical protein